MNNTPNALYKELVWTKRGKELHAELCRAVQQQRADQAESRDGQAQRR